MFKKILTTGAVAASLALTLLASSIIRAGAEEQDYSAAAELHAEWSEDESAGEIPVADAEKEAVSDNDTAVEAEVIAAEETQVEEVAEQEAVPESESADVQVADSADTAASFTAERREISDWSELLAALRDEQVSEIVFLNDIERTSTSSSDNLGTINRSLKIDGNGHTLIIARGQSGSTGRNNSPLFLGSVSDEGAVLEVNNLVYNKTYGPNLALFTQSAAGWTIKVQDVSAATTNAASLINATSADVELRGTNSLLSTGAQSIIAAKTITVVKSAQVEGSISSPSSTPAVYYADEVIVAENARMKGVTSGAAYGMSTGDFIMEPGSEAEFLASGASYVSIYIRQTGSIKITEAVNRFD